MRPLVKVGKQNTSMVHATQLNRVEKVAKFKYLD